MGGGFHIILAGVATVYRARQGEREPKELAQWTHPSHFGERGLEGCEPRSTGVKALTPLTLLSLSREAYEGLASRREGESARAGMEREREKAARRAQLEEEARAGNHSDHLIINVP